MLHSAPYIGQLITRKTEVHTASTTNKLSGQQGPHSLNPTNLSSPQRESAREKVWKFRPFELLTSSRDAFKTAGNKQKAILYRRIRRGIRRWRAARSRSSHFSKRKNTINRRKNKERNERTNERNQDTEAAREGPGTPPPPPPSRDIKSKRTRGGIPAREGRREGGREEMRTRGDWRAEIRAWRRRRGGGGGGD